MDRTQSATKERKADLNTIHLRLHLCLPLFLRVVLLIKLSSRFRSLFHIHRIDLCLRGFNLLGHLSYSYVFPEICHASVTLVDLLVDDGNGISGRFDIRGELADPGFVLGNALFAFLELAAPFFADVPSNRHNKYGPCQVDDVSLAHLSISLLTLSNLSTLMFNS